MGDCQNYNTACAAEALPTFFAFHVPFWKRNHMRVLEDQFCRFKADSMLDDVCSIFGFVPLKAKRHLYIHCSTKGNSWICYVGHSRTWVKMSRFRPGSMGTFSEFGREGETYGYDQWGNRWASAAMHLGREGIRISGFRDSSSAGGGF